MVFMKWKSSASRKAKIRKLLLLVAEEAGKAEAEAKAAAADYTTTSTMLDRLNQCAVCFGPTTSRCSRCKAVRYCSGKCQIVHWRKGHRQECQLPDSSRKPDSPILLVMEEIKSFDSNIQETRTIGSVSQMLGPCSAEIPETSSSVVSDVLISIHQITSRHMSLRKTSTINGMCGCESAISDVFNTCTEALPNNASSDTGSPSEGINHFSENTVICAPSFADAVNVILCSSERTFNACNSPMYDLPASTSFVNNLRECVVSEHEPNGSSSFSHNLFSLGRFVTDIAPDSPDKKFISKNDICDHLLDHTSITNNCGIDTFNSENSMPNTESEISLLNVPSSRNSDNILSSGISSVSVPCSHSSTRSSSERCLIISDTCSSSLLNIIKFQNQETNESNATVSADEIQGPITSVSNGARKRPCETILCSSQDKNRVSGCTFSSKDDANIDEDSVSVHNPHPTTSGLKRSKNKSAQQPRSPKASTENTAQRKNVLVQPTKLLFPYEYFTKLFNWDILELPPRGLINCGNSCFANVVLQCLTYTRPLAAYLLHGSHSEKCQKKDWCFMCELEQLVSRARGGDGALSPIKILSRIKSIGNHLGYGRQEDAHEFLRFAIDTMQSICLDEAGGEEAVHPIAHLTTFIQQTFGGYLQSKVKCKKCDYESNRYEIMMDLTVEVNGNIESLEDALKQFAAAEFLDGENKYKCDRCKSYVQARKWLTVHEAPNILTIALKRFQTGNFGKLNKIVAFPEVLDMSPYMSGKGDKPPLYKLYAVVVHLDMLNASFFGHYICYVKDLKGAWYKIDDSKVNPVALDAVMSEGAYMLFYSRSSPRPPAIIQDGKIPGFKDVPLNHCIYDATETLLLNEDDGEADVAANQFPSRGFSGAASIHINQPTGVRDTENCSMDLDSIVPDKLDTFGSRGEGLNRIMQDKKDDLIPREYGDLTSSDTGSLFSGSDETSCSTDSNRDSIST
ncbi:hypothetical protein KI387_037557, partial [Taxus chinensis]